MSADYNHPAIATSSSMPRRLPAPPKDSRRISRPLPKIPRALACKGCGTSITSHASLLPESAIPPNSRSFSGFSGKALLFTEVYNVVLAKPAVQLMATGAHTMQEITCANCTTYLGWKIVRAHESTETWKEGYCLLELESLQLQPSVDPSDSLSNPRRPSSPTSDSEYSF